MKFGISEACVKTTNTHTQTHRDLCCIAVCSLGSKSWEHQRGSGCWVQSLEHQWVLVKLILSGLLPFAVIVKVLIQHFVYVSEPSIWILISLCCIQMEYLQEDNLSLRNLTLLLCYLYIFGVCTRWLLSKSAEFALPYTSFLPRTSCFSAFCICMLKLTDIFQWSDFGRSLCG